MIGGGVHFGLEFGMLDHSPVLDAYHERIVSRPAFRRAGEIDEEATGQSGAASS